MSSVSGTGFGAMLGASVRNHRRLCRAVRKHAVLQRTAPPTFEVVHASRAPGRAYKIVSRGVERAQERRRNSCPVRVA